VREADEQQQAAVNATQHPAVCLHVGARYTLQQYSHVGLNWVDDNLADSSRL
jgi:hypothetical protein